MRAASTAALLSLVTKVDKLDTKMDKLETKMDKVETKMELQLALTLLLAVGVGYIIIEERRT